MKKFYTKLSRPQWRIAVPNINTTIFGKTTVTKENSHESIEEKAENLRNSGTYDLVNEQNKMDNRKSATESITATNETKNEETTDDSDQESKYEDASPMYEKKIDFSNDTLNYLDDMNIYADVENVQSPSEKSECSSLSYEYDIPRISFSFFEESLKADTEMEDKPITSSPKRRSEIKIVLAAPPLIEEDEDDDSETKQQEPVETIDTSSQDDISISATRCEIDLEPKTIEMDYYKSLDDLSTGKISKCGSEPSIDIRVKELEQEDEEGFYKVPKSFKRLSQSLSNFNTIKPKEDLSVHSESDLKSLDESVEKDLTNILIEHNVVLDKIKEIDPAEEAQTSLEYCDARSKLPAKIRRATLLRKPHMRAKAQDTWSTLRSKVSNMISSHSAAQRVGANTSGEKMLNLEEFYKNSRTKCRKIVHNTSKIFNKKRGQENVDPNSDTSSQIVKNDAFFAKVDLNEDSSELCTVDGSEVSDKFGSRMLETEKAINDFDFGTLKSAFRRSKYIQEVQEVYSFIYISI